jgi:hypothetical protein
MRLTSRDIRILQHLRDMRYLHRGQIQRLEFDGRAESNVKRRLTLAYHAGLVGRRLLPSERPYGSPLALYYLERAGQSKLREVRPLPDSAHRRRRYEEREFFLRHLIDTNDVRIAALLSAQSHGLSLAWSDELTLRRRLTGQRLPIRTEGERLLAPIADGFLALDVAGVRMSFAVELDRATVEERRSRRKLNAYGRFHEVDPDLPGSFFRPGLRVLYVVSHDVANEAARRERQLQDWCAIEGGGTLFWFTSLERVRSHDFFLGRIWSVIGRPGRHALIALPPRVMAAAAGRSGV